MPSLEDTDPETVGAVQLIQDQWRTVQARRMREIRRRMKMASKIQGMWRLNKQKESQAKEEEEARLAKEEAEAEWADVILARAELKEAEASGNKKRIAKAMTDLARETREAEEAQENAEREMREAEEAKAAAVAAEARAAEARAAEEAALARGKPRRPRPVTPPRKPGQKVLSAKTRRAISGRPAKKMSSSRSRPLSSSPIAERESEAGSRPPDDIPEDILREQKLQGKKTFSASMFGANGGAEAKEKLEEEENQPDWWQSQAGAYSPTHHHPPPIRHPSSHLCRLLSIHRHATSLLRSLLLRLLFALRAHRRGEEDRLQLRRRRASTHPRARVGREGVHCAEGGHAGQRPGGATLRDGGAEVLGELQLHPDEGLARAGSFGWRCVAVKVTLVWPY